MGRAIILNLLAPPAQSISMTTAMPTSASMLHCTLTLMASNGDRVQFQVVPATMELRVEESQISSSHLANVRVPRPRCTRRKARQHQRAHMELCTSHSSLSSHRVFLPSLLVSKAPTSSV